MSLLQAIVLGLVQGLSEFLPISSSAHLVLVPWLLRWPQAGLFFDTLVHWGTAAAVIVYFRAELWTLIRAWVDSLLRRRIVSPEARLAWLILAATVPAAISAFLLMDWLESLFSAPAAVAALLLVTGAALLLADRLGRGERGVEATKLTDALVIGCAQAVAVAPGISRSGSTIAAGVLRGLSREAAARFSFLLSVPIILGAGLTQLYKAFRMGLDATSWGLAAVGLIVAALAGYLAIAFMLRHLQQRRLWPFAVYCWATGLLSLLVFALRG